MKNSIKTICLHGFLLAGLLCVCNVQLVFGQRMSSGTDGVAGDPGTNGTDVTDGFRLGGGYFYPGIEIAFSLFAPSGGHAGDGGDGVDGSDPDSIAQGGTGGDGGNGGRIAITGAPGTLRRNIYHWSSGSGGDGGRGGVSEGDIADGFGGDAGRGGNVYLNLSSDELFQSRVTSGSGGHAWGNQAQANSPMQNHAGSGGSIDTTYRLEATGTFADYGFVHELTAGDGGIGFNFADAGNGGHVTYQSDRLYVDPKNAAFRTQWDLVAGNGGAAYGATAGTGGTSKMILNNVVVGRGAATDVVRSFRMNLTGGDGGSALQVNGLAGSAANGGHAILEVQNGTSIRTFGAPETRVVARLIGGQGGDGRLSVDGGIGGSAIMGNLSIDTRHSLPGSSSVYFEAILDGGDGGASQMGNGGDGGHAHYNGQAAKIWGNSDVQSLIIARGGAGGSTPGSSNGGNASVRMNNSFVQTDGPSTQTRLKHQAFGGHAFRGKGGNATAETRNTSLHDLSVDSQAYSGSGNGGHAGSATAISRAETTSTEGEFFTVANSHAEVGLAYVVEQQSSLAYAESTAISAGGSATIADAKAIGGRALYGGHGASSRAYVEAAGQQYVEAKASSTSLQALDQNRRRAATAHAFVVAPDADARANSIAEAHGQTSEARSYSSVQSSQATARSTAYARWAPSGRYSALSTNASQIDPGSSNDSLAVYSGLEGGQFFNDVDYGTPVRTFAAIRGGNGSLVNIETTPLATELDFDSATSLTFVAGDYRLGASDTAAQIEADFQYRERVAAADDQNHFHAFFYDFESINGGFDEFTIQLDVMGTTYLDQTFSDAATAIATLDSSDFDIGLRGFDSQISYSLLVNSNHQTNQSFEFKFGFGEYSSMGGPMSLSGSNAFSAVPEPNGLIVLSALSGLACLLQRKRRVIH